MKKSAKNLLDSIDALIRQGHGLAAAQHLKKIKGSSLNAEERVQYAYLARRLSLPNLSLRLLNPIVRPTGRKKSEATPGERIEYAGALIYIGAMGEALDILNSTQSDAPNRVLLRAFSHIGQWNYAAAIPLLREYIQLSNITHYQKLVGEANLCEALNFLHDEAAAKTIEHVLQEAEAHSYTIVRGHLLMTKTSLLVLDGKIDEAKETIDQAGAAYQSSDTIEAFFVRKWWAIVGLYEKGDTAKKLAPLQAIRKEAIGKWFQWETLRDCDFYEAICTHDPEIALYLYQGTPFESFRKRLLAYFPELKEKTAEPYVRKIPRDAFVQPPLEFFSGDSDLRRKLLESGKLNARLLSILSQDFYRPLRVPHLSSLLYPGEFYNPDSSAKRVREAIRRLRQWFSDEKVPLKIEEVSGDYRLAPERPVALLLPKAELAPVAQSPKLDLMRESEGTEMDFSVNDVCRVLGVSARTANRLIQEGIESGILSRSGAGRATRYAWAAIVKKAA